MTALIMAAKRGLNDLHLWSRRALSWRLLIPLVLLALGLMLPEAGGIMVETIAEAYLQVSVFVAFTLALIYGAERLFNFDMAGFLATHPRAQVPVAAFLGALPGCGGAIVVVTQYVNGHVGFGALIAVLTATMGDAAFLLLAREPMTGLMIFGLGMVVGTISGYLLEAVHGREFMRQQSLTSPEEAKRRAEAGRHRPASIKALHPIWVALMLPGVVFAVPIAMQIDPNTWFGSLAAYQPVTLLGFLGGVLALMMWAAHLSSDPGHQYTAANPSDLAQPQPTATNRVINDTNFVTVWVIAAFLLFELGVHFTGADLNSWFAVWAPLTPLIAALVGFLPGCGPQIIVTTLYLTGAIPMAALFANAISNDGDALFPAIALAPKAAIVATLYTGIPALIVGYTMYFLMS
ncbi:putative manganese transporter [Wenzhouxiangella sp. EGI_FJ10409]|uniref:putative manganese transporter n=1 Tax=Wenzhouxiangella sp. EGI_FJ10409 TaxID=3243767 RepID=UPI0035E28DC8